MKFERLSSLSWAAVPPPPSPPSFFPASAVCLPAWLPDCLPARLWPRLGGRKVLVNLGDRVYVRDLLVLDLRLYIYIYISFPVNP